MTIFFDLDGPILDVSERYFRVHRDIVEQLGGERIDKRKYWHLKRDRQSLSALLDWTGITKSEETYRAQWLHKIELMKYLQYDTVIHGSKEQLKSLRQRHTLILVTLRQHRDHLDIQLKRFLLRSLFTSFTRDALVVGDTEVDIRAGRELGLMTVAVQNGIRNRERLAEEHPDFIIEDINALPQILKGN
jgi:phosphoglycolate phosphatase-like HAD superfamily hydrolase